MGYPGVDGGDRFPEDDLGNHSGDCLLVKNYSSGGGHCTCGFTEKVLRERLSSHYSTQSLMFMQQSAAAAMRKPQTSEGMAFMGHYSNCAILSGGFCNCAFLDGRAKMPTDGMPVADATSLVEKQFDTAGKLVIGPGRTWQEGEHCEGKCGDPNCCAGQGAANLSPERHHVMCRSSLNGTKSPHWCDCGMDGPVGHNFAVREKQYETITSKHQGCAACDHHARWHEGIGKCTVKDCNCKHFTYPLPRVETGPEVFGDESLTEEERRIAGLPSSEIEGFNRQIGGLDLHELLLGDLNRLRYTWRFNMSHVNHRENVAEHSYYVAVYAFFIGQWAYERGADVSFERLLTSCLFHDAEESRTGDFSRLFKHAYPDLRELIETYARVEVEKVFTAVTPGIDRISRLLAGLWSCSKDSDVEGCILSLADFLSVFSHMWHEINNANATMLTHYDTMLEYAGKFNAPEFDFLRPVCTEVQSLVNRVLCDPELRRRLEVR